MDSFSSYTITPIGHASNGFVEKFGTPRNSQLVPSMITQIKLLPPYNTQDAFLGIENFSHLWITFYFHQNRDAKWSPTVRPPRLGGNKKKGVFATRSSYRPNLIGQSVVKLINYSDGILYVTGADFMNNTPILDIKPYIKEYDSYTDATSGWTSEAKPFTKTIHILEDVNLALKNITDGEAIKRCLEEVLSTSIKVAYKKEESSYGLTLFQYNFRIEEDRENIRVLSMAILP